MTCSVSIGRMVFNDGMVMQKFSIEIDVAKISAVLGRADGFVPFPKFSDQSAWQNLNHGIHKNAAVALIEQGALAAHDEIPSLSAELFMDYQISDERLPYETPQIRRRQMLGQMALSTGLSADRNHLVQLKKLIFAILDEPSWAWPAHCPPGDLNTDKPVVDLSAAMTAFELAETSYLLGDVLSEELKARIKAEIDQRCITPFLSQDHHWMARQAGHQVSNWAAVCICGIVGAALYLEEDTHRLAQIITRGMPSLHAYIDTFDADGGSTEGPAYWSYGFCYFTAIAHLLSERSAGKIDLFDDVKLSKIATFPLRTQLSVDRFVNFSDSDEELNFVAGHLGFLATRLNLPQLTQLAGDDLPTDQHATRITWMLRDLIWQPEHRSQTGAGNRHDWFADIEWMIARIEPNDPNGLVVAAKGGHNYELHNQNDVGSFLIHWQSKSLISELGRGRYVKGYFGDKRYEFLPTRSRGHSVPIVNGCEQAVGADYKAQITQHSHSDARDILQLDLTAVYPDEAKLKRLNRKFIIDRKALNGEVTLIDAFEFLDQPREFTSTLICRVEPQVHDGYIIIADGDAALKIIFDANWLDVSFVVERDVAFPHYDADVYRLLFSLHTPKQAGAIHLRIVPQSI